MNTASTRNDRIEKAVIDSLVDGYLPCAVGLNLGPKLGVTTGEIGAVVDNLGIRVTNCQLGCFKVEKATHDDLKGRAFSDEVRDNIRMSLVGGRLSCRRAHELGRELGVGPKEIGDAATAMKIKISDCQLGCFY